MFLDRNIGKFFHGWKRLRSQSLLEERPYNHIKCIVLPTLESYILDMLVKVAKVISLSCLLMGCSVAKLTEPSRASEDAPVASRLSASTSRQVVVTYHPMATKIGYDILNQGGNAFDAFVAATAAEYVLGEGVTSLGGPLGALLYDSRTKKSVFLDAGFNDPFNPKQKWDPQNPLPGTSVLVPGAVAGLEAISTKYGKLPFNTVLEPAINLAEGGFPLNSLYAALIRNPEYGARLKQSSYGSSTYFKDGRPLVEGDVLKLPLVAQFLKKVAKHGSKYVYTGPWAKECIKTVNAQGGHLLTKDFSSYKAKWTEPWKISYRGLEIYAPQNNGGLNTLLSLKVLEHIDITKFGKHFSESADALEVMTRVQSEVMAEPWLYDNTKINDSEVISTVFSAPHVDEVWSRVQKKLQLPHVASLGTHSYHVIVIDSDGNAVTGTNTIESFPWGNGIFVEGIPLTAAGTLPFNTKPGERRRSPLSMQIGIRDGKLKFASGAFSASLIPTAFEFIVNIVDFKMSADDVVNAPRFGAQAWDLHTLKPTGGLWLDPRVDQDVVKTLTSRGLKFIQQGYLDTGLGSVAVVHDNGTVEGAITPLSAVGPVRQEIVGVGISLEAKDNSIYVNGIVPNTSAASDGTIHPGDQLLAVQTSGDPNGSWIPISDLKMEDVFAMIRGVAGTPVALRFKRGVKDFVVVLIRHKIVRQQ